MTLRESGALVCFFPTNFKSYDLMIRCLFFLFVRTAVFCGPASGGPCDLSKRNATASTLNCLLSIMLRPLQGHNCCNTLIKTEMDFLFHSVYNEEDHSKYFNVYKLEDNRFLAECHHFNRERDCLGDFEIVKEGGHWKPNDPKFNEVAQQIGEEIERMDTIHPSENTR